MKKYLSKILPVVFTVTAAMAAHAQATSAGSATGPFYKWHNADVGVAATGQFTTSITSQNTGLYGVLPHQATTDSPGVLFTLRDHPFSWAGVEFNYQYSKFSERYIRAPRTQGLVYNPTLNTPVNVTTSFHEATAAYLFHVRLHKLQPYVAIGGGGLDFVPTMVDRNQWRLTGLVDMGLDMQTHSRLGFRIGARDLIYRAPDYYDASLSSSRWVSTEEPYGGVYVKF
jgi:hypothetical protein